LWNTGKKTETMVISRKVNKPHHPSLIINNQQLEDVKYHKHLGVAISDDGSWNKRFSNHRWHSDATWGEGMFSIKRQLRELQFQKENNKFCIS
jgi:hypothetical protein